MFSLSVGETAKDALEEAIDGLRNLHGKQNGALLLLLQLDNGLCGLGALSVRNGLLLEQLLLLAEMTEDQLLDGSLLLLHLSEAIVGLQLNGLAHMDIGGLNQILETDAARGRSFTLGQLWSRNQKWESSQIYWKQDIGIYLFTITGCLTGQRIGEQVEIGLLSWLLLRLLLLLLLLGFLGKSTELSKVLVLPVVLVSSRQAHDLRLVNVLVLVHIEWIREEHQAEAHYLGEVREGIGQEGERLDFLVDVGVVSHVARGVRSLIQVNINGFQFLEGIGQEGKGNPGFFWLG